MLFDLVRSGRFGLDRATAEALNALVAKGEAIESGVFRDGQVTIGGTEHAPRTGRLLMNGVLLSSGNNPILAPVVNIRGTGPHAGADSDRDHPGTHSLTPVRRTNALLTSFPCSTTAGRWQV